MSFNQFVPTRPTACSTRQQRLEKAKQAYVSHQKQVIFPAGIIPSFLPPRPCFARPVHLLLYPINRSLSTQHLTLHTYALSQLFWEYAPATTHTGNMRWEKKNTKKKLMDENSERVPANVPRSYDSARNQTHLTHPCAHSHTSLALITINNRGIPFLFRHPRQRPHLGRQLTSFIQPSSTTSLSVYAESKSISEVHLID